MEDQAGASHDLHTLLIKPVVGVGHEEHFDRASLQCLALQDCGLLLLLRLGEFITAFFFQLDLIGLARLFRLLQKEVSNLLGQQILIEARQFERCDFGLEGLVIGLF